MSGYIKALKSNNSKVLSKCNKIYHLTINNGNHVVSAVVCAKNEDDARHICNEEYRSVQWFNKDVPCQSIATAYFYIECGLISIGI